MTTEKFTKQDCITLLQEKYTEILASNLNRYPKKSDFSVEEVAMIKSYLGPFPRALEIAGIKPPRDDGFEEKKLQRRIRSKRRKTAYKVAARKQKDEQEFTKS